MHKKNRAAYLSKAQGGIDRHMPLCTAAWLTSCRSLSARSCPCKLTITMWFFSTTIATSEPTASLRLAICGSGGRDAICAACDEARAYGHAAAIERQGAWNNPARDQGDTYMIYQASDQRSGMCITVMTDTTQTFLAASDWPLGFQQVTSGPLQLNSAVLSSLILIHISP